MAQLSVANYFNNKKRPNVEEGKLNNARKVLILDEDNLKPAVPTFLESHIGYQDVTHIIKTNHIGLTPTQMAKKVITPKRKKIKCASNQGNIRQFLNTIGKQNNQGLEERDNLELHKVNPDSLDNVSAKVIFQSDSNIDSKPAMVANLHTQFLPNEKCKEKDKSSTKKAEPTLSEIAQKLNCSSRLAEIKASIARFQQSELKLETAKQKTQQTKDALSLKSFKTVELEINLSPQKIQSPEKPYLSPKKDIQGARKNLFGLPSPVKQETSNSLMKQSLTLPYKYRYLAEIFRSIDTVCQILHNRKEIITFKKLKPAVEAMLKRNLTEKHIAQIKLIYPAAFILHREKMREFGTGTRNEKWELVLKFVEGCEQLTPEILLERRRKLFNLLIEKVKDYHQEFLATLDPPMKIERTKITRWHPSFDIEKVPDIELGELPPQPIEETLTTGHQVLQKAREMFNCNTRMERALERLQESSTSACISEPAPVPETSILKGIPKALLERVRQKQAAKALESMTRSATKEKEVQLYSKLPEIARLTRNLFVTEKKSVLLLDLVIDKLCNSHHAFLKRSDVEKYLRTIAEEIHGWLVFHDIRGEVYVKLLKNSDLSVIMNKLQKLAELKDS